MLSIGGSICLGDKTSCCGTVITGAAFSDVNGRPVARVDDQIACMKRCVITSGNPTEIVDGAAMALHGSQTSGDCTCISANNNLHGDGQSAAAAAIPAAADVGIAFIPALAELLNEDHWVEFRLVDAENKPISHQKFVVVDPSGTEISGSLDENGHAQISPVKPGLCTVNFPDLGHAIEVSSCPT